MTPSAWVRVTDWQEPTLEEQCVFGIPMDVRILRILFVSQGRAWRGVATATAAEMQHPDLIRAKERNVWESLIELVGQAAAVN